MNILHRFLILSLIVLQLPSIFSQSVTLEEYENATSFLYNNYHNKTVFNLYTPFNWWKDESGGWFNEYSLQGKTYYNFDVVKGEKELLFDHEKVASALSSITKDSLMSHELPINEIEKISDKIFEISVKGIKYSINLNTYDISNITPLKTKESEFESTSPDGRWIAFTKDYNIFIKSTINGEMHQLSYAGCKDYEYASWYGWFDKMEGEHGERPQRFGISWSPDSKWIMTNICDTRNASKMYMLDFSVDSLYRPNLLSYYRGSPGDTNMVHIKPVAFNIDSKKEVDPGLPKNTHINAVSSQWTSRSGKLISRIDRRGYQKTRIVEVDLNAHLVKDLIVEESKTNIDNFWYRVMENKKLIIFLSERSGWRQLYAYNMEKGEITPLTQGSFYVNDIVHFNEDYIYLMISGKDPSMNPYHQQLFRVDYSGKMELLTPEKMHHRISMTEDGKYFSDNMSTVDQATLTVVRKSENGDIIGELTRADVSWASSKKWKAPETFKLTGKDGKSTIFGAIWKPTSFDSSSAYPIIDATYTGPHTQVYPKSFDRALSNQALAELGFIVMAVDGLGTSGRSKEFHDHSYKNMGDNLRDHVLAIQHLGRQYSWVDTTRVGIFGHSAGGYDAAHGVLAFPDVYKVAVASSADHDFRMEKAWWPEMYMGWPVDSTYHEASNITMAGNLKGKLLIVHGGLDDNVNASATFKLAEALVKADKEFDMLIFPSQRHGYGGKFREYFTKKRWNYFIEHLLGKDPVWNIKWE